MANSQFRKVPDFTRIIPRANLHRIRTKSLDLLKLAGLGAAVPKNSKMKALSSLGKGRVYHRDGQMISW